jgi:hypothetical protein
MRRGVVLRRLAGESADILAMVKIVVGRRAVGMRVGRKRRRNICSTNDLRGSESHDARFSADSPGI